LSDQYQTIKIYLSTCVTRFVIAHYPTQLLLLYSCKKVKKRRQEIAIYRL